MKILPQAAPDTPETRKGRQSLSEDVEDGRTWRKEPENQKPRAGTRSPWGRHSREEPVELNLKFMTVDVA